MAICKWCGEENADGVNVCSFCGQDMSIFEDSGMMKHVDSGSNASEASRPHLSASSAGPNMNSGSFSASAVRNASRTQQAQKKSDFVTRNQLKQVAYRLDSKSKRLSVLTAVIAIAAVAAIVLGALGFVRSATAADHTDADATIAQLQSKVSTLELELQTVNAKLAELQTEAATQDDEPAAPNTSPTFDEDQNPGGVNITTTDEPDVTEPTEPSEPPETSETTDPNLGSETTSGEPINADTEIEYSFNSVDGDGTSVYATVEQEFEGSTTYQWQKKPNTSTADNWTDVNTSAAKTNELKISIDDYLRNNSYRCRVTNVDSKGVTTVYYTEVVDYNDYQIWALIG